MAECFRAYFLLCHTCSRRWFLSLRAARIPAGFLETGDQENGTQPHDKRTRVRENKPSEHLHIPSRTGSTTRTTWRSHMNTCRNGRRPHHTRPHQHQLPGTSRQRSLCGSRVQSRAAAGEKPLAQGRDAATVTPPAWEAAGAKPSPTRTQNRQRQRQQQQHYVPGTHADQPTLGKEASNRRRSFGRRRLETVSPTSSHGRPRGRRRSRRRPRRPSMAVVPATIGNMIDAKYAKLMTIYLIDRLDFHQILTLSCFVTRKTAGGQSSTPGTEMI